MNIIDRGNRVMQIHNPSISREALKLKQTTNLPNAPMSSVYVAKPYGKPCHILFSREDVSVDHATNEIAYSISADAPKVYIVENFLRKRPDQRKAVHPVKMHSSYYVSPALTQHTTILFGYWNRKLDCFFVQNVTRYAGLKTTDWPLHRQLAIVRDILSGGLVRQRSPNADEGLTIHVPFFFYTKGEAIGFVDSGRSSYAVYSIVTLSDTQPRFLEDFVSSSHPDPNPKWENGGAKGRALHTPSDRMTLLVQATPSTELYELYEPSKLTDGSTPTPQDAAFVGHAMIPDFKTSRYMNAKFHKVRENADVDLIEESEDEEDFEKYNHSPNKWLVNKTLVPMQFEFHPKHRKWCPIVPPHHINTTRQNK